MKPLLCIAATLASLPAWAHDGHGLFGSHWHATDTLGFVAGVGAMALAVWLSRQ